MLITAYQCSFKAKALSWGTCAQLYCTILQTWAGVQSVYSPSCVLSTAAKNILRRPKADQLEVSLTVMLSLQARIFLEDCLLSHALYSVHSL